MTDAEKTDLEQWRDDVLASMDKDIDGILGTPERYVRFKPEEGALRALENSLMMLLAYRFLYRFRHHDWHEQVVAAWPEDREVSEVMSFAELCDGDETFDRWVGYVREAVAVLREKYDKTDEQVVDEMVERVHAFKDGDDVRADGLIDDLMEITGAVSLGSLMRNFHGQEQPRSPGAKVYNRIMERVDVATTDTGAAFWVLSSANLIRAQLPEWSRYVQRLVEELVGREREGTLEKGRTSSLLAGFLERSHFLWLIENDPDNAAEWRETAKRHRVALEAG